LVAPVTAKKDGCVLKNEKLSFEGCNNLNNKKCTAETLCIMNNNVCTHVCDIDEKKTCKKQTFKGEKICKFVNTPTEPTGPTGKECGDLNEKKCLKRDDCRFLLDGDGDGDDGKCEKAVDITTATWVVLHAELPCANGGNYQTQYNTDGSSREGVANAAACQAICAAASECDFFSYSPTHFWGYMGPGMCATYYQGTCAVGDVAFAGKGYTTYVKPSEG